MSKDERMRVRRLADRKRIFSVREVRALGVGYDTVVTMAEGGEIWRVYRGVYRYNGVTMDEAAQLAAAVKACGPGAVACRASAARLLGLPRVGQPSFPEVCVPYGRGNHPPGVLVHRTRSLPDHDVTHVDGTPVTTGERTLIDLAGVRTPTFIVALLDDAVCARVVSRAQMHARATELQAGRRNVGLIVRLTAPGAEEEFNSWLERTAAHKWRNLGVPEPQWNVPLYDADGLIGLVDAHWRWRPLTTELEGMRFHTTPEQRERDGERFTRLTLGGHRPLRFTYKDIMRRPEWTAHQIQRGLAR